MASSFSNLPLIISDVYLFFFPLNLLFLSLACLSVVPLLFSYPFVAIERLFRMTKPSNALFKALDYFGWEVFLLLKERGVEFHSILACADFCGRFQSCLWASCQCDLERNESSASPGHCQSCNLHSDFLFPWGWPQYRFYVLKQSAALDLFSFCFVKAD